MALEALIDSAPNEDVKNILEGSLGLLISVPCVSLDGLFLKGSPPQPRCRTPRGSDALNPSKVKTFF